MTHRHIPVVLALTAALGLSCSQEDSAARHALLIGVSDYAASGLHNLPGARHDVTLMKEVLMARLGYQAAEIRTLLDGEATHSGMEQAFAELAKAVRPGDFVYVHYSGHGSLVRDFNDGERSGFDQTLVSYGARASASAGLDGYDILDDELNRWLAPIAQKAGELVFVADACHSATNTRGEEALVARAAPADTQADHPHAHDQGERQAMPGAILIGAARDDESAHEMPLEDGSAGNAGLFTWNWARSLQQAAPTDTWRRVFERANLWVSLSQGSAQHPQLTGGAADRPLFGGKLDPRPGVPVREVRGQTVTLGAGRLSGITVGSVYAASEAPDAARVRITDTRESWSGGTLESGTLKSGDFLIERDHAYATAPLKLFALPTQDERDQSLVEPLRERLGTLRGFVWTESQANADLVLAVLRPRRVAGKPQYRQTPQGKDTLPVSDPSAAPEVWVLTPGETLLHEHLITALTPPTSGIEPLAMNLQRYRRAIELRRLIAESGSVSGVTLGLIAYETCASDTDGCIETSATGARYRRMPCTRPIQELTAHPWPKGALLSFALENPGRRERYVYLFELAPDGAIRVVFPTESMNEAAARLGAGERLELPKKNVGLMLDQPGDVSLLALATQKPIDPRLLIQSGYEPDPSVSGKRGTETNPLERLLGDALAGSGKRTAVSIGTGTWGGTLIDYHVDE
jgi:hypothetical protein